MPIYEYECSKCGHTLEVMQKISGAALTKCPVCNKRALHKRMSAAAFHLKGSGWYVTDFKDKPKAEAAGKKAKEDTTAAKTGKEDKESTTMEKTKSAKKSEPTATE